MSPIQNSLEFIISTCTSLYITIVLFRFLLQTFKADFYSPLSQFVVKATNPVLIPIRRIVPGMFGIDIASIILAFSLQFISQIILIFIKSGILPTNPLIFAMQAIQSVAFTIGAVLDLTMFIVFITIILSWVSPYPNQMTGVFYSITEPLLRPIKRKMNFQGGLDFSPMILLFLITLLKILLVDGIIYYSGMLFR